MPIPRKPRVLLNRLLETTFDTREVEAFLIAFGDDDHPLPETVKCLDEIVTDYIIETCHEAASVAHHARRAKIKLDDFKFMLRRDTTKLGRVSEMLETDKELKRKRKAFDTDEGAVAKDPILEVVRQKEGPKEGGDGERKKKKKKKDRRREGKDGEDGETAQGIGAAKDKDKGLDHLLSSSEFADPVQERLKHHIKGLLSWRGKS